MYSGAGIDSYIIFSALLYLTIFYVTWYIHGMTPQHCSLWHNSPVSLDMSFQAVSAIARERKQVLGIYAIILNNVRT